MSEEIKHKDLIIAVLTGTVIQVLDATKWHTLDEKTAVKYLLLYPDYTFRIKKPTIIVNGVEVPKHETEHPAYGTDYWVADVNGCTPLCSKWINATLDIRRFNACFIYLNEEDAKKRIEAMKLWKEVN